MPGLKIVRVDVPYTDLPKRMSTLDARSLLKRAGLEDHAESFEPRAGATRVTWSKEPSSAQLATLERHFDESDD